MEEGALALGWVWLVSRSRWCTVPCGGEGEGGLEEL